MGTIPKNYRFSGSEKLNIAAIDTSETGEFETRDDAVEEFVDNLRKINKEQQKLYAQRKEGVIFLFQSMDAAGKDGTIRTVFSTLSPHGVKEYCFKAPSDAELSHDFLWRFWSALPAKGNISIFNRSYYEDVLIGKVHKLYLDHSFPDRIRKETIIEDRYEQIRDFERYLFRTGTRVVKIFLHVSKDEQARRFISRIDLPEKNWKISANDIRERAYWDDYMEAFETMINRTSDENSPWYVVPSDHKWYARLIVSRIVLNTLREMSPRFPEPENGDAIRELRQALADSLQNKDETLNRDTTGVFSHPDQVSVEMISGEERRKSEEKRELVKTSGFRKVQELLASDYILKSRKEMVKVVSQALSQNEENEKDQNKNAEES